MALILKPSRRLVNPRLGSARRQAVCADRRPIECGRSESAERVIASVRSQQVPLEQHRGNRGHAKNEEKDRQLVRHRIPCGGHAKPHVESGNDEPKGEEREGRDARSIGELREELGQQQKRREQQEPGDKKQECAHRYTSGLTAPLNGAELRIASTASAVSHNTTSQSDSISSTIDCRGPFLHASLE